MIGADRDEPELVAIAEKAERDVVTFSRNVAKFLYRGGKGRVKEDQVVAQVGQYKIDPFYIDSGISERIGEKKANLFDLLANSRHLTAASKNSIIEILLDRLFAEMREHETLVDEGYIFGVDKIIRFAAITPQTDEIVQESTFGVFNHSTIKAAYGVANKDLFTLLHPDILYALQQGMKLETIMGLKDKYASDAWGMFIKTLFSKDRVDHLKGGEVLGHFEEIVKASWEETNVAGKMLHTEFFQLVTGPEAVNYAKCVNTTMTTLLSFSLDQLKVGALTMVISVVIPPKTISRSSAAIFDISDMPKVERVDEKKAKTLARKHGFRSIENARRDTAARGLNALHD